LHKFSLLLPPFILNRVFYQTLPKVLQQEIYMIRDVEERFLIQTLIKSETQTSKVYSRIVV
jgi:hypothetical protein